MRYLEVEALSGDKGRRRSVSSLAPPGAFPVIDRERKAGRTYLDSAATSQKPVTVIEAVRNFYRTRYANVHRGLYRLGEEATQAFEGARASLGRFIGAEHPDQEIIFCRGATEAVNLVARAWGDQNIGAGDEIVLTTMEHHSNLVPWQMLCRRTGARLKEVRPDSRGIIPMSALEEAVGTKTRIVGMTHVSNVLGTKNDVKRAAKIARAGGAVFLVDGAQALGHMSVDVRDLGCDLYVGSGHKMFGPSGIGFLYGRRSLLETFEPFMGGGDMIEEVHFHRATYAELPARLEAGTPNLAGAVGLGAAVSELERMGPCRVEAHDREIVGEALSLLEKLPWIEIYGPRDPGLRSGSISFNIDGIHAHDAASALDAAGVAVRAGHLCAQPLLRFLGISSCVRASFALYNESKDVERLVEGLRRVRAFFSP